MCYLYKKIYYGAHKLCEIFKGHHSGGCKLINFTKFSYGFHSQPYRKRDINASFYICIQPMYVVAMNKSGLHKTYVSKALLGPCLFICSESMQQMHLIQTPNNCVHKQRHLED